MILQELKKQIVFTGAETKYQLITHGIQSALAKGILNPGDKLPPQRELADELGVTLGTVTRAYKELDKLGLVRGETGRGTFIARREIEEFTLHNLHNRIGKGRDGVIRFDLNFPVSSAMPDLGRALLGLSKEQGLDELLRYQPTAGMMRHRTSAVNYLSYVGLHVSPENVAITTGAQHAIFTALASRLSPGDSLAVDQYTYPGLLNIAGRLHLRLVPVSTDQDGMNPDELASLTKRHGIKGVYLIPTFHNPTTHSIPETRRGELARVIGENELFLIEDDVYGRMEENVTCPVSSLIPENSFYITNLSKTLAPGLRVGFVTVPQGEMAAVERVIAATTWMIPPLVCEVASRWIEDGTVERILQKKKVLVKRRIEILTKILANWNITYRSTSMHCWLELPSHYKSESFARQAATMGVQVVPASNFATHSHHEIEAVRICVGPPESEGEVRRGAEILDYLLTEGRGENTPIM